MEVSINKIAYNVFEPYPNGETISVSINAKFGASKEDYSIRAFFLELNIDGEDAENGDETRNFALVARLNYQIDKNLFPNIDENEMAEDGGYFHEFLKRINEIVVNITSQDDIRRPLDIDQAIENHKSTKGE